VNSDYEYQDHELLHRLVADANLSVKCIAERTNYSRGYVSEVRRTHLRREKAAKARAEEKQKMLDDYAAAAVAVEREACARQAATELCRLQNVNQQLLEALNECVEDSQAAVDQYIASYGENFRPHKLQNLRDVVSKARAAIAKAEAQA